MSKEENPWTHLSSTIVYKNQWMSIREDRVVRPDGEPGIYAFLEKNAAAGVVALTPDNYVYLVGQYRYPLEEYSWEVVEGGAEDGEDPLTAAKRELQEEVGLIASKWMPLATDFHISNCVTSERGFLYLAQDLSEVKASPEGTEILQIKKGAFSRVSPDGL